MPRRQDIKKIMVIGSGPIVIGQAAEFDYAGTQACLALKEEGIINIMRFNHFSKSIKKDKSRIAFYYYVLVYTVLFLYF